jgi:hypothetical protein
VSDPEEIKTNILEHNQQRHFRQGNGFPFTKGDLGQILFSGTGPLADSILAGMARSDNWVTQLVLDALKKHEQIPDIKYMLTLEEFVGKLNNWKETTSTSPITKRHLGHYKCLLQIIDQETEDDKPDKMILQAKCILHTHYSLLIMQ